MRPRRCRAVVSTRVKPSVGRQKGGSNDQYGFGRGGRRRHRGASGIGAAISRAFTDQGAKVAVHFAGDAAVAPEGITWEHAEPARKTAEAIVGSLPNARAFVADLSIEGSEVALVDAVSAEMGEIDVLINNAAHCESPDVYQGLSSAGLERHSARAFPGQVGYGSSKVALEALTRGAALDLGGKE